MSADKKKASAKARKGALKLREAAPAYSEPEEQEKPIRKNLRLYQSRIDEARRVLGTSTETETIETALDLVVFRHELVEGVEVMRGTQLDDVFGEDN